MKQFFGKVSNFVKRNSQKLVVACGLGMVAGMSAEPAHAVAVLDFTAVGTSITSELTPAITAAMPIAGIILAAGIGWKLYKRFCR